MASRHDGRGDCSGDMVTICEESDFQILAQFAKRAQSPRGGRRAAEFGPERIREMAVAGKAEIERQQSQIIGAADQAIERRAQSQAGQVAVHRYAAALLEDSREVERREMHFPSNLVERDSLADSTCEVGL